MSKLDHGEYSEDRILLLKEKLICRDPQILTLQSILGEPHHYSYPSIFVYGHTATGKTYVTQMLLKTLKFPHVIVNCVECFSSRMLFEQILNELQGHSLSPKNEYSSYLQCNTLNEFVLLYKQVVHKQNLHNQTVYIVLDKAEHLREMDSNLLPGFLRFQELAEENATVIFLSEIVWEKFRPSTGCFEPLILHFPDYSKADLQKILSRDHPPGFSADFYATYINILLGVFYTVCRDLKELRHLAAINFPKFCEPVQKGDAKEEDTRRLWRNIEPHLKKTIETVYLREVSSSQWERLQQEGKEGGQLKGLSAHAHVELPFYSKFLLIAAYLSSYNPARTDKRFFSKHHGKIKKTSFLKKHEKTSNHLLGPKPFPLDRLLAIFYSIVDSRVTPTANIFSQIASLVALQLITHVGHDDQLDGPKYKCTTSLDFITAIARTVNFDIVRYLYDFL
ncbi:origin recognition complex subunit 5 isoform X1 [Rhincodon typus]|uniref:origin recognition complex subunit 5 isoform X1 n=1 Tax=Rhincodon typus TaxID=259920 RepID=UPI0009A2B15A|nr:origin recognition complex subunit 5 isoform X1 [Rhincodon typus]XP_048466420.1 origin recognition complex subunit 5 isoform X1 [Rhincodon typus]XP_048466421.1 origin recognition complex subunit 5 isoform X1 [Rhincodon typus]